jgi:hypothetical protein
MLFVKDVPVFEVNAAFGCCAREGIFVAWGRAEAILRQCHVNSILVVRHAVNCWDASTIDPAFLHGSFWCWGTRRFTGFG